MKELRLLIVDARQMNMICSLETYVNELLADLYADSRVSDIKLESASVPDYFVFSYYMDISEHSSDEEEYKPP